MERMLTTEEVAELARTVPSTVRHWRQTGKGPHGVKRGKRVLYPESAVQAWLLGNDSVSSAEAPQDAPGSGLGSS